MGEVVPFDRSLALKRRLRTRCRADGCHEPPDYCCDFIVKRGIQMLLCNAPICTKHRQQARGRDLCPAHYQLLLQGATL